MTSAGGAWRVRQALHRWLRMLVAVKEKEVPSVLCSFFALFSILASYFLLLPLREDAGISLGTSNLPTLFGCSLLVTLLFTPAASAFLSRTHPQCRERALKRFYFFMAFVLVGFYIMYSFSSFELLMETAGLYQQQRIHVHQGLLPGLSQQHIRHTLSYQGRLPLSASIFGTAVAATAQSLQGIKAPGPRLLASEQSSGSNSNAAGLIHQLYSATSSAAIAARMQTVAGTDEPCRMGRCHAAPAPAADITTAAFRWLQQLHQNSSRSSAPATLRLNNSDSGAVRVADCSNNKSSSSSIDGDRSSSRSHRRRLSSRDGDPTLSRPQRLLRGAFYVWVNVMNLVGISSLWARCADAFTPEAGARLFGFISAGATLGQLMGSLMAMLVAWTAELFAQAHGGSSSQSDVEDPAAPAAGLILGSAVLQLIAAQLIVRVRPTTSSADNSSGRLNAGTPITSAVACSPVKDGGPLDRRATMQLKRRLSDAEKGTSSGLQVTIKVTAIGSFSSGSHTDASHTASDSSGSGSSTQQQGPKQLRNVLTGFKLILRSRYLLMMCSNLLLTYVVGSLMYFQRALVVSTSVKGPSYRTAFFAALNTWSAACILLMQLFATSSVIRHLGMQMALGFGPFICLVGIVCISAAPSPAVVAAFEVIRKVFGYAVYRPSREVLFTVVSRDEKYSAKLVIDTVVQRMGDALAAAAFEVLDVRLGLGQAGIGAAGFVMCCVWLATAHKLGQQHKGLASGDAEQRQKAVCE